MKVKFYTVLAMAAWLLGGCGGTPEIDCDEEQYYQTSKVGKRVKAPEGLDDLDPLREMPLPEASPREPRPEGSPCFDRPPEIQLET